MPTPLNPPYNLTTPDEKLEPLVRQINWNFRDLYAILSGASPRPAGGLAAGLTIESAMGGSGAVSGVTEARVARDAAVASAMTTAPRRIFQQDSQNGLLAASTVTGYPASHIRTSIRDTRVESAMQVPGVSKATLGRAVRDLEVLYWMGI